MQVSEPSSSGAIDALAGALAGTFPPRDDSPLALALLRTLAEGRPVAPADLARTSAQHESEVAAALTRWPNVHLDLHDRAIGFAGLTLTPTPHHFETAGQSLYTWCAWDTLFLPALLDATATVTSTCPVTGTRVELTVSRDRIADPNPQDLLVSFPPIAETDTADITGSFCCHVHFLAGEHAAEAWLAKQPQGHVLRLDDALELGHRTVAALLPLV